MVDGAVIVNLNAPTLLEECYDSRCKDRYTRVLTCLSEDSAD